MSGGKFEWDGRKAAESYAKHGVRFEAAARVFDDPFAIEWLDNRHDYGEERYVVLGVVDGRLLAVVCTARDDVTRIISARGAEPYERRLYHEENR